MTRLMVSCVQMSGSVFGKDQKWQSSHGKHMQTHRGGLASGRNGDDRASASTRHKRGQVNALHERAADDDTDQVCSQECGACWQMMHEQESRETEATLCRDSCLAACLTLLHGPRVPWPWMSRALGPNRDNKGSAIKSDSSSHTVAGMLSAVSWPS